jgi:hypothetical protein
LDAAIDLAVQFPANVITYKATFIIELCYLNIKILTMYVTPYMFVSISLLPFIFYTLHIFKKCTQITLDNKFLLYKHHFPSLLDTHTQSKTILGFAQRNSFLIGKLTWPSCCAHSRDLGSSEKRVTSFIAHISPLSLHRSQVELSQAKKLKELDAKKKWIKDNLKNIKYQF